MIVIAWFVLARYLITGWEGTDLTDLQNNINAAEQLAEWDNEDIVPNDNLQNLQPNSQLSDTQKNDVIQKTLKDTIESDLYVAIPHWVNKDALLSLTDQINDSSTELTLYITQAESTETYHQLISDPDQLARYDLVLLPSSTYNSYHDQSLKLPFEQNIISWFHPSLRKIIEYSDFSFLPFALDPIITYADEQIADDEFEWTDIQQYLFSTPDPDKIPLWFGISAVDTKLLAADRHPLWWYTHTLDQIISSTLTTARYALLPQLIWAELWDFRSLYKASEANKNSDICRNNISICLYLQDKLQVGFGSFTDLIRSSKQLDNNQQKYISSLPNTNQLTVTARGWVAPITATHRQAILARLVGYLQQGPSSNLPLRDTSLSVFQEVSHLQLLQTDYAPLASDIKNNNLTIIQWSQDNLKTRLEWSLMSVLEWNYSAKLYIEEYRSK